MGKQTNIALRFQVQKDFGRELHGSFCGAARRGEAGRKRLRLDCLPPSGNSGRSGQGMNASKKLELPPTKKNDLNAPGKKTGTAVKKEKPKHMPPKVKGAEPWHDCPAEFFSAAKAGLVSGRITIQSPGPGLLLKEVTQEPFIMEAEEDTVPEKIDSSAQKLPSTSSKQNRTFPKPKGKSK